ALFDPEFFMWLTMCYFVDLVKFRFGPEANDANFGVANPREGLLFRLWLRAEIAYSLNEEDPYIYAKRGDMDFWRSHVLRPRYANARDFAKAFLRYQFRQDKAKLTIAQVRELAKRLTRAKTNVIVAVLNLAEATQFIEEQAERVIKAGF